MLIRSHQDTATRLLGYSATDSLQLWAGEGSSGLLWYFSSIMDKIANLFPSIEPSRRQEEATFSLLNFYSLLEVSPRFKTLSMSGLIYKVVSLKSQTNFWFVADRFGEVNGENCTTAVVSSPSPTFKLIIKAEMLMLSI